MLPCCTKIFQIILLAFHVKLFAKQKKAMQLRFHQSYAIKSTQNFHYFHSIRRTQIEMKGMCPARLVL